jgi:DNA-binding transcriptional LysR family regulator
MFDNRFSLYKLEVFCRVVDAGGVGRAAQSLYVTQSVVSAHLRSLQEHLDVQLLERDGRGVRLTEPGRTVYAWACETLSRTRRIARELEELATGTPTTVTVIADASLATYVIPAIVCQLQSQRPDTLICVEGSDCGPALAAVGDARCELAIVTSTDRRLFGGLIGQEIGRADLVLVGGEQFVRDSDAATTECPLITSCLDGLSVAELAPSLADRGRKRVRVVARLAHPEAVKVAVRQGLGMAVLPRSAVANELALGELHEVPLSAPLSLHVYAVLPHTVEPTSVQQQFIALLEASLATPARDEADRKSGPLYAQLTAVA